MLTYRPYNWTPADSLVIGKLLALQQSGNYLQELLRARLAHTLSSTEIADLFPEYPKYAPVTLRNLASFRLDLRLDALLGALPNAHSPPRSFSFRDLDGRHI